MENVMTLRGVRTLALAAALGAACGGGDPPGGGNNGGTTDGGGARDGTTGNGDTDGYVPDPNNPLITAIPGVWELVELDGQPRDCDCVAKALDESVGTYCNCAGEVTVEPTDPDCSRAFMSGNDPDSIRFDHPRGDACIDWFQTTAGFVLRGDEVYVDFTSQLGRFTITEGRVLDGGRRITYHFRNHERVDTDGGDFKYEKIR